MRGIRKTTFREIKASLGRFLAIFGIVALGVGFFAGLKVTTEAMIATVSDYLDRHGFYDLRLVSTLGFDQENVDYFASARDVEAAEGSVSFDVLYELGDEYGGVIKTYSMPEQLNTLKLVSGRFPETGSECVVDSGSFGKSVLGGVIRLSEDNEEGDLEHFTHREYTIVGLVQSSLYIQFERGNTTLGSGRLDGFVYLSPEGFDTDYFTEVYVRFQPDFPLYSREYDDFIREKETVWEEFASTQAQARYERIFSQGSEELADARAQLEDNRVLGQEELEEARETLDDARARLEEGDKVLQEAWDELAEGEQTILENQRELSDGRATIAQKETELAEGEALLVQKEAEIAAARTAIDTNEVALRRGERELSDGKAQLRSGESAVAVTRRVIDESRLQIQAQLEELRKNEDEMSVALAARLEEALARLDAAEAELRVQEQELEAARAKIAESEKQLDSGWIAIASARAQLEDGERALSDGKLEIESGKRQLADAKQNLEDGEKALAQAREELEEGRRTLAEKQEELESARQEYTDGEKEYEEAKAEFIEKIAEAEGEIADGQRELDELTKPDTYVLGRDTNIGYVCFENDSSIVEGIANIFPVFFFLVAALVCITTMNRMVEEQRTQIGVLKALGYGEGTIMSKYMIYSGLASLTGCIFGFFAGTWGFPKVIWFCYGLMYATDPIAYVFDWKLAAVSLAVSLLCSMGATWFSCRMELAQVAASLMRPKAPEAGKRVLLEYLPFIWKRLSFLHKVSLRNIFRYKKRLFMMIMGISGCTALLVTGFGVRDSIADIADKQFGEIQLHDLSLSLKESADHKLCADLDEIEGISGYFCAMETSMDLVSEAGVKSVYLVAGTREGMAPFLSLHTAKGEEIAYPAAGEAVISNKLAEEYNVRKGEMITLRDSEMRELSVVVTGIYENYIYNYVHISEDTWREQMGEEPDRKTVYLNLTQEAAGEEGALNLPTAHGLSAELMQLDQVLNVTVNSDMVERIGSMLSALNIIVVVVILCAAGLAFIVLYNLTNINITERIREIATIKVLGFYRRETNAYVFRENVMLSVLGLALGLGLGYLLHRVVMNEIRVNMIAFCIQVKPLSYLYSALLTLLFAWLVNAAMGGRLEAVSMTESLKSVD
ncbi:MAG: FtsX-like permease family protein [Lachnospiraceae bacterium]|nr:FtsX-like permease family protein [Lachnospiraceae bacterium]